MRISLPGKHEIDDVIYSWCLILTPLQIPGMTDDIEEGERILNDFLGKTTYTTTNDEVLIIETRHLTLT